MANQSVVPASQAKIATSIFQGKPNESLLTVDAYGKTPEVVAKNTLGALGKVFSDAIANLQSGVLNFDDLLSAVDFDDGKVTFDSDQLESRISSALGTPYNAIKTVSGGVLDDINTQLEDLTGIPTDKVKDVEGNIYHTAKGSNTFDVSNLFTAVSKVTKTTDPKIQDQQTNMAICGGLVDQAIDLGVPDAIDTLMDKYNNSVSKTQKTLKATEDTVDIFYTYLKQRLAEGFGKAAEKGDFYTAQCIVKYIGSGGVLTAYPRAVSTLCSQYTTPLDFTYDDYADQYNLVTGVLAAIDPYWDQAFRGGTAISSLNAFSECSEDLKKVLCWTSDDFLTSILIAGTYPITTAEALAKEFYPKIALA